VTDSHYPFSIVHIASGDLWAGAEMQLSMLIKHLAPLLGNTLTVILFNEGQLAAQLRMYGGRVIIIDEKKMSNQRLCRSLLQTLARLHPDIIHCHGHKESTLSTFYKIRHPGVKLVRTYHGSKEYTPTWKQTLKYAVNCVETVSQRYCFSRLVAVAPHLAIELQQQYPASKIVTIVNGVDINTLEQKSAQKTEPLGTHDQIKIAMVGRLIPLKRVDLILESMPALVHSFPNLHFYIFGSGPAEQQLKALALQSTVTEHIHFRGHQTNIYPYMTQFDLLLMPSDHEGLPMTLLEAMALNCPVAAHAVGGMRSLLQDGEFGYLTQQHNVNGYITLITEALKDRARLKNTAARAKEHVRQHYNSAQKCQAYLRLYQELTQPTNKPMTVKKS